MKKYLAFLFVIILSINSSVFPQNKNESIVYLKSNLQFLSSDELEGRETASRSEKIASLFIAQELNKYGIKPFAENGTYFQEFDINLISIDETKTNLSIIYKNGSSEDLLINEEFVLDRSPIPEKSFSGKKYKMVLAGYGVESEEENYSDYENLDVKGKMVVVFPGSPVESHKNLSTYKLSNLKQKTAEQKGAAGIISLLTNEKAAMWPAIVKYLNGTSFKLEGELKDRNSYSIPNIVLSYDKVKLLFNNEIFSFDSLEAVVSENKPFHDYFEFEKELELSFALKKEVKKARNIIGILEGNDEKLKNEFVTVGGHYDHLGIRGEKIYNGADDNGSGTVCVMETARLMAHEKKNKRSVLFILHTGEEKGLKGAKYLTGNLQNIIKNSVVHINIDMVGRGSIDTLFNVGSGKLSSELFNIVQTTNKETVNFVFDYKFDAPDDPENIYNRSDHKHYADNGIPIVFFFDNMKKDYHRPTDTVDKIDFNKMFKVVELAKALATNISNLDHKIKVDNLKLKKDKMEGLN